MLSSANMTTEQKPYTMTRITTAQLGELRQLSNETGIPIIWLVTTAVQKALVIWRRDGIEVSFGEGDEVSE